jgi:hypothetical protein
VKRKTARQNRAVFLLPKIESRRVPINPRSAGQRLADARFAAHDAVDLHQGRRKQDL